MTRPGLVPASAGEPPARRGEPRNDRWRTQGPGPSKCYSLPMPIPVPAGLEVRRLASAGAPVMGPLHPIPCLLHHALAIAVAWVLCPGAAPLQAQARIRLDQPTASRETDGPFLLKPQVHGAVADPGYHLAVAENGKLLARFTWPLEDLPAPGPGGLQWTGLMAALDAGVQITFAPDGSLVLGVDCREAARTFQVRVTSREQPSTFRTVTLQVTPGTGARTPAAETKLLTPRETKTVAASVVNSHIWPTPFSAIEPQGPFTASTWDPTTKPPSIVTWSNENRLVRKFLDGRSETLLEAAQLDPQAPSGCVLTCMAITASGDLVFQHGGSPRLWRLDRKGQLKVLAGTGRPESCERYDDAGNLESMPALEAGLHSPAGLVARADGSLVFSDLGNGTICQLTPEDRVETLVGSSRARRQNQDLTLRHPAQVFKLDARRGFTAAPDGTLLFVVNGTRIGALAPDGCILRLPYEHHRPIQHLVVTPDREIVLADAMDEVWLLDQNGQVVQLANSNWFLNPKTSQLPKAIGTPSGPPPLDQLPAPCLSEVWGFNEISHLAVVPGGILVTYGSRSDVAFIGPRQTDHLLAERILAAAAAMQAGRLPEARRIWRSLKNFADADPDYPATLPDFHVSALARPHGNDRREPAGTSPLAPGAALRSLPEKAPLPRVLQEQIIRSLPDYRALAIRARIAMHLLDRKMRAAHPEAWAQVLAPALSRTN